MATQESLPRFSQGFRCESRDAAEIAAAIDAAFDYRGDVTLLLDDGSELHGFLGNRSWKAAEPFVELFVAGVTAPRRLPVHKITGLVFSGKDTASGRSWETWLKKYRGKVEAQARGEAVEAVGLFPEPLDESPAV
jgi:hypothetical protein